MKNIFENEIYQNTLEKISNLELPWGMFSNKAVLITGGCGLIASFLVDLLCYRNQKFQQNIKVVIMARQEEKVLERFKPHINNDLFEYLIQDVCDPICSDNKYDFIIHAASGANPFLFSTFPVDVMKSNFIGMLNILEYTLKYPCDRVYFVSSGEIYGESDDINKEFDETDFSKVDINLFRSCYPVSKMATETLAQSFIKQYNTDIIIGRFSHIYGPTYTQSDNRVISQFINNVLSNNNIILKSQGLQKRSYCYVADAVSAILYQIFYGTSGESYNISNDSGFVTIRELAILIASKNNVNVDFVLANTDEKSGYTTISQTVMSSKKLQELGWKPLYSLSEGLDDTVNILKGLK